LIFLNEFLYLLKKINLLQFAIIIANKMCF